LVKDIIVCISDESSAKLAATNNLQSFTLDSIKESGKFGTRNMNIFTLRKIEAILFLIEKGIPALYTDTDIVFMLDPMKYSPNKGEGYSIVIQLDRKNK
jgi:hypothetical protein